MKLFLYELGHLLSYLGVALIVYLVKKEYFSVRNLIIGTFTAFFIDIDHLYDYFLNNGFNFSLVRFFSGSGFGSLDSLVLPFHAWEFAFLMLLIWICFIKQKEKYSWYLFLVIGFIVHLTFDVISNGMHWTFYLITYRLFIA